MSSLIAVSALPPAPLEFVAKIREVTERIRPYEHTFNVRMEHVLHGGMYARTAKIDEGMAFTSVLIKLPTMLVVHGECAVHPGDEWRMMRGYNVLPASAGRTQAYVTFGPTEITMLFPTDAKTVEEAEAEFTDEWADLLSRRRGNDVVTITGIKP